MITIEAMQEIRDKLKRTLRLLMGDTPAINTLADLIEELITLKIEDSQWGDPDDR